MVSFLPPLTLLADSRLEYGLGRVSKKRPERNPTRQAQDGGRNVYVAGVRQAARSKQLYRIVDFGARSHDMPASAGVESDPNRTANWLIASEWRNGEILAPR